MITIADLTDFSLAQVLKSQELSWSLSPVARPPPVAARHRSVQLLCDQNLVIGALPAGHQWWAVDDDAGKSHSHGKIMMDFPLPCLVTNGYYENHCSYHFYLIILNASYDHCDEHEWWLLFLWSYYSYYSLLVSCIMINYYD